MKLYDKTKWIVIFVALAMFAVAGIATDSLIAEKMYMHGNYIGSVFSLVLPVAPLVLCSFAAAVFMSCRNTMGTRKKNKLITVLCGVLSYAFAFAAAYYPFAGVKNIDLIIIGAIAAAIAGSAIYLSFTSFKYSDQKEAMMCFAKRTITATLVICAVCAVAYAVPHRICYDSLMQNVAMTGKLEGPFSQKVPLIPFVTAGAPVLMNIFFFREAIPKLRFSEKPLYILPCLWVAVMIFGIQLSGTVYVSEASAGAIVGSIIVLLTSKIFEKTENSN